VYDSTGAQWLSVYKFKKRVKDAEIILALGSEKAKAGPES